MGSSTEEKKNYDYSLKITLIGDSNVGKSSLLFSFIDAAIDNLPHTIGADSKTKMLTINGKNLKLMIWDTAGQERFRSLTSSYYRGAHGIILVYDITRRVTFANLSDVWAKEIELYSTYQDCVKILVGNKVDRDSERAVTREEGLALAKKLGYSFIECSAKTRENVQQCLKELCSKILEFPSLLGEKPPDIKNLEEPQKEQKQEYNGPPSGGGGGGGGGGGCC